MSRKVVVRLIILVLIVGIIVVVAVETQRWQATSGKLKIQILGGLQGVDNLNQRIEGFKEAASHRQIEFVKTLFNEENPNKSLNDCENALKAHPGLAGFFASNAFGGPGAAGAIGNAIKLGELEKGRVHVVAFDTTEDILNAVDAGLIDCTLAQNTQEMGRLSVEKLAELAKAYKKNKAFERPAKGKDIIDTGVTLVWPRDVPQYRRKPSPKRTVPADAPGLLRFALVPKSIGHPYWEGVREGMEAAAAKLGVKAVFTGPPEASPDEQIKIIEDFITKGYDGIGISPNDKDSVKGVIQRAMAKGIAVVTFDSDSPDSERLMYIGTDNRGAGRVAGKAMLKVLGLSGASEEK